MRAYIEKHYGKGVASVVMRIHGEKEPKQILDENRTRELTEIDKRYINWINTWLTKLEPLLYPQPYGPDSARELIKLWQGEK